MRAFIPVKNINMVSEDIDYHLVSVSDQIVRFEETSDSTRYSFG